jgi:hypothetical protein
MRITRESLLKMAKATVANRTRYNRRLICIYLTGSLVEEEFLLGGAADIDMVFVHDGEPPMAREIEPLTEDIHLDIAHLPQNLFNQPRSLRSSQWIGSYVCHSPIVLHDTQHWFEFTQAAVCAQFYQPENVIRRARPFIEDARQTWLQLHSPADYWPDVISLYLKGVQNAANSIATLSGPPLSGRRFLLKYPQRTAKIGLPDLAPALVDLLVSRELSGSEWQVWLSSWSQDYAAAAEKENRPAKLHPARKIYYRKAIEALQENNEPAAALWTLLVTWTQVVQFLGSGYENDGWQSFMQQLGLEKDSFNLRLQSFDTYLDTVEEAIDGWADRNGV